jgi:hypothetical protein
MHKRKPKKETIPTQDYKKDVREVQEMYVLLRLVIPIKVTPHKTARPLV